MHHVQHPGAPQDFQAGHPVAVALHDLAVRQHGGKTGEEHEHLGGIAETDIAQGDLAQGIVGDVIPENEDQRQAPKKIDARVASVQHGYGLLSKVFSNDKRARLLSYAARRAGAGWRYL